MSLPEPYLLLGVAAAGVATHLFFFKIGEHHLYPMRYVQALLLVCGATVFAKSYHGTMSTKEAVSSTTKYAAVYLVGLYTSLVVYRLFFNPLNKIPGPYWARLTKLNFAFRVAAKLDSCHDLLDLHRRYGKFVRIGPNDVSVTHADAVEITTNPKSKCTKGPWYSQDLPMISMHTARDRPHHDRRRRVWSPAFSDKALRGYENRIEKYNDLLIQRIEDSKGQPLDMSKWFNLYSFDVMGDLAFGASYNMLQEGELHWAIKLLNGGMDPLGLNLPPWLFRVITSIPGLAADYWKFIYFCNEQLDGRIRRQGTLKDPDITHTLVEHFQTGDAATQAVQLPMLQGDSRLIIVAGSDTTAATLVHLFYHICTQKDLIRRLRAELDSLVPKNEKIEHAKIQDAPLLNGAINETLRLNPPVPSGVFRKTPKEGIMVGDTYIPGNTVIQMPGYVMARDPDNYQSPEEFIPERFSSKPELIRHKDAWGPFGTGPYGCIGKNLAYLEVRLLTANLIRRFDVNLDQGEDGSKLLKETKDHFTLGLGEIKMRFTERTGV